MYKIENKETGELWYFSGLREIAKYLDVSYQSAYFAEKKVIKKLKGFEVNKVDKSDPIVGKYFKS